MKKSKIVLIAATVLAVIIGNEVLSLAVLSVWVGKFLIWFCGQASKGF